MSKIPLILIVGPTAVGKTNLSIAMAKQFHGEVISGDSMQVYKGMDIGTAKVTMHEREGVPHHLIDILEPDTPFSVADFQRQTKELIIDIDKRKHVPFIVGGTGLYVQSVTHNYQFSDVSSDNTLRNKLQQRAEVEGQDVLYAELLRLDPDSAKQIHPNNIRRVIRALEVVLTTEKPFTAGRMHTSDQSEYDTVWVGLTMERPLLYDRINQRVDLMIEEGLIEEVESIISKGYSKHSQAMTGIGYKEIVLYLQGVLSKDEAIELLKKNTRRFAKRQITWFGRVNELTWFDLSDPEKTSERFQEISHYIAGKLQSHEEYGNDIKRRSRR